MTDQPSRDPRAPWDPQVPPAPQVPTSHVPGGQESERPAPDAQEPGPDGRQPRPDPDAPADSFSLVRTFGGWSGLLDTSLPGLAFVVTYTAFGHNLRLSLIVALALGVVFAAVRLVRRDPLQNVVGGFVGVAIAAIIANATGKAEDFYLPGLFINAAYALAYLIANLVRWPLIGVVVGLASGWGMVWRQDPVLLRAFLRAGWLWAGFFALKVAVQLPLYLAGEVVALGITRVVMGWPLWLVLLWLTYLVVKSSVPQERWSQVKQAAEKLAQARGRG